MTPIQPPTPEEVDAMAPTITALLNIAKWIGGPTFAAWLLAKFLVKFGIQAGKATQQYTDLAEDVEAIKKREKNYITISQHDAIQKNCTDNLHLIINNSTHKAMTEIRAEMGIINGNVCKIMGALNIQQDNQIFQGRRKDD